MNSQHLVDPELALILTQLPSFDMNAAVLPAVLQIHGGGYVMGPP